MLWWSVFCVLNLLDHVLYLFFVALGFVGYAPVIAEIIADHEISDTDDDQLYYTNIYLDETKRVRSSLGVIEDYSV